MVGADPGGTIWGEVVSETPSGKPLPSGSRIKGKLELSSEQERVPRDKSIVALIDKRVGRPSTLRKAISVPKANDKISGSLLFARYGTWYQITAVI